MSSPSNDAPQIMNLQAEEIANGLFVFTGEVIDENPSGMTIYFGGSVDTMNGQTAIVGDNGKFILIVQLQLDGSDVGIVTAQTIDNLGQVSNVTDVYVQPTP